MKTLADMPVGKFVKVTHKGVHHEPEWIRCRSEDDQVHERRLDGTTYKVNTLPSDYKVIGVDEEKSTEISMSISPVLQTMPPVKTLADYPNGAICRVRWGTVNEWERFRCGDQVFKISGCSDGGKCVSNAGNRPEGYSVIKFLGYLGVVSGSPDPVSIPAQTLADLEPGVVAMCLYGEDTIGVARYRDVAGNVYKIGEGHITQSFVSERPLSRALAHKVIRVIGKLTTSIT